MDSLHDIDNNQFIITIPPIPCSFQWSNHPDALQLKEISDAWLVDRCKHIPAACKSELTAKLFSVDHIVNSAYSLCVTGYFANAVSTQRVLPILKLMSWFFMLDTCVDEPSEFGADPANATLLVENVMALFSPNNNKIAPADHVTSQQVPSSITTLEHVSEIALPQSTPPHNIASDRAEIACDIGSTYSSCQHIVDELAHILTTTAEEWWSDMCVDMPLSQQERFREVFKGYLCSILEETPFRSACHLPDVHTYLNIRSHTIGWYPLALLTEYTLCMEMDQEALTNPLLLALKQTVCESIILVNDITSFGKEYMRGDFFNIIMVLCLQKLLVHCDTLPDSWPYCLATPVLLQECMFEACEMIRERDQECVRLINEIKRSSLMQKPGMESFLEAMANYVSGNIYWHLTSERYGVCANDTNDKHTQPTNVKGSHHLRLSRIKL